MTSTRVQFAVVREDPQIEKAVIQNAACRRGLMIASGGCTALALVGWFPGLHLTLLDPNPAQLARIQDKIEARHQEDWAARLNLGDADPSGLSQHGNFEKLFRGLRHLICEMVVSVSELESAFTHPAGPAELLKRLTSSPYWSVAFELYFSDTLLRTLFGDDAIQYAVPGSYPSYFQSVIERGLAREDAWENPFLHHILLSRYRAEHPPDWLRGSCPEFDLDTINGFLSDVTDLSRFDFIGLSNILDWMPPEEVDAVFHRLRSETSPGTVVLWRQLNNRRDLAKRLSDVFSFDAKLEAELYASDRSLFYSSIHIGTREKS